MHALDSSLKALGHDLSLQQDANPLAPNNPGKDVGSLVFAQSSCVSE